MLAPELILFSTLFAIPIIWTLLKVLVNHLIDSEHESCPAQKEKISDHDLKAA